jgi:hypothetical protein
VVPLPAIGSQTIPRGGHNLATKYSAAAVQTFLADAVKGKKSEKEVTKRVKQICQEDDKNLYLEARDSANKDAVIHRSYLKK